MPEPVPLLRIHDLAITRAGAERERPQGVTFDVHAGEVILVLGPSGAGKSTLALAFNGLLPQSVPASVRGTVEVGGRSARTTPVALLSADVAMVFQDPDAQIVTSTVLDEVAFALENMLLTVPEILTRSEDALRRVGLWERRTDRPDVLSGGGRQRLAIACAIAMGSSVIVLDEPTANLDPQGVEDVYRALADLVADGSRAIVLIEHDLDAAMHLVTRVLVLDQDGRLVADGSADHVLRHRADELTALGVWLPSAAILARSLRDLGALDPQDPLPLTPGELAVALDGADTRGRTAPRRPPAPASDGDPIIRARGLTIRRGRSEVIHEVDLDIARGSLTAVIGTNGAGKTTLAQALAGVVPPPKRRVSVDGLDPGTVSPRRLASRIGFVFQNPEHQFIAHTVFDELAHGPRLLGDDDVGAVVEGVLRRLGLEHRAAAHPLTLSGGEKRRLSVGTALVARPRVLVLDEPTYGQDRARADELLRLLEEL
ncbi:ABC transporter ATP-binding protein, partial [Microbacterium gubbeenense]